MARNPPRNLEEFVKGYLFDREVELLKKEAEIQKLRTEVYQIKQNVRDFFGLQRAKFSDYVYCCYGCFKPLYDGKVDLEDHKFCYLCNDEGVCKRCEKTEGGTIMEVPYLEEFWVCQECYDESITRV